jgi:hypothetical protein
MSRRSNSLDDVGPRRPESGNYGSDIRSKKLSIAVNCNNSIGARSEPTPQGSECARSMANIGEVFDQGELDLAGSELLHFGNRVVGRKVIDDNEGGREDTAFALNFSDKPRNALSLVPGWHDDTHLQQFLLFRSMSRFNPN